MRTEQEIRNGIIELDTPFAREIGFTSEDFSGYLWRHGDRVIVSLIESRHPGQGNLSRLFAAIEARGLRVAVPTPFAHMQAILRRKGFVPYTDGPVEVWEKPHEEAQL